MYRSAFILLLAALAGCSAAGPGNEQDALWDTDIPPSEDFNGNYPAWGPDGKHIVFSHTQLDSVGKSGSEDQLWVANLETGDRHMIALGPKLEADWNPNGQWLAAQTPATLVPELLFKIEKNGKQITWLTGPNSPNPEFEYTGTPRWSPNGNRILFSVQAGEPRGVAVMKSDGSDTHFVTHYGVNPSWFPSGDRIVYIGWDEEQTPSRRQQIYTVNADGTKVHKLTNLPHSAYLINPIVSPNGKQIAFVYDGQDGGFAIYLMDKNGSNIRQVTRGGKKAIAQSLSWHPNGKKILFNRTIPNVSQRLYILDTKTLDVTPVFPAK